MELPFDPAEGRRRMHHPDGASFFGVADDVTFALKGGEMSAHGVDAGQPQRGRDLAKGGRKPAVAEKVYRESQYVELPACEWSGGHGGPRIVYLCTVYDITVSLSSGSAGDQTDFVTHPARARRGCRSRLACGHTRRRQTGFGVLPWLGAVFGWSVLHGPVLRRRAVTEAPGDSGASDMQLGARFQDGFLLVQRGLHSRAGGGGYLARSRYSPVRVSTRTTSPTWMKDGTLIFAPVSRIASLG